MKQLVTDIKFLVNDNLDIINPPEKSLIHRSIINNPTNHSSGNISLNSTTFKEYDFGKFNYIFIVATNRIAIVLDDKLAIFTSQFTYVNKHGLLSAKIFPHVHGDTSVKFVMGNFSNGNVEAGSSASAQECIDSLNFDAQVDALIYNDATCLNPLTTVVMDELEGLCEFGFTWDSALQQLIINDD